MIHSSSSRAQAFLETVLEEFDAPEPDDALRLLRRLIRRTLETGHVDVRRLYTFPRPGLRTPLPLRLHLTRSFGTSRTWLLCDDLE